MPENTTPISFGRDCASAYDQRHAKLAPMRDALHLLMRLLMVELPEDARVLCVGAGTGAELLFLARAFPRWRFCAVDPAAAMLEVCRERVRAAGLESRCTFHEGYIQSLPPTPPFDAATSLLVSHFIQRPENRREYFSQIGARLRPGGSLVIADLAADLASPRVEALLDAWTQALMYTGFSREDAENRRAAFGTRLALLPIPEVESIIATAGFERPVLFFQALLMHGWHAVRT